MLYKNLRKILVFVLSVTTLTSCETSGVSLNLFAPKVISLRSATLPVTAQLQNNKREKIELMAGTPCAIFDWKVLTEEGNLVETEPNKLCSQVVAYYTLESSKRTSKDYTISLNRKLYSSGKRYRLVYTFWGYSGEHIFEAK